MSENEVTISNEKFNLGLDEKVTNDNYHYIGVMFESKYGSSVVAPKFYGKVYEYKTTRPLKEGEVVEIPTMYGKSRVVVVKPDIPESELQFKEIDKIKEI